MEQRKVDWSIKIPAELANMAIDAFEKRIAKLEAEKASLQAERDALKKEVDHLKCCTRLETWNEKSKKWIARYVDTNYNNKPNNETTS